MASSKNRKKQVNVTKHRVFKANPALSASTGGTHGVFFYIQPQRLNAVGEECKRGRRERGEPGLSKSSDSKRSNAGHPQFITTLLPAVPQCFLTLRFIRGYMSRGQAKTTDNSEYLAFVRQNYLSRLKDNLPKTVLDKTTWLPPPAVLAEVHKGFKTQNPTKHLPMATIWVLLFLQTSELLRKLHYRLMVRKYVRSLTPQKKAQVKPTRTELLWLLLVFNDCSVVVSA